MDTFRLNMRVTYGPNAPTVPAPIPPAVIWVDVAHWQVFLNTHTPFHCTNPPNDVFGNTEMNATVQFQASLIGGPAVTQTASVDAATFAKAVAAGMPAYPTVVT